VAIDTLADVLPSSATEASTIGEADEAVTAGGWARMPCTSLGEKREVKRADHAVTVRCLVAEDGSVPDYGGAPSNVAVVARAY
jgi:prolyl-tRNA synthetase